jgi:serine/threonine-protein kinase HipA
MERELSVCVDLKGQTALVGRLWVKERLGRESATFEYDASWLKHPQKFALGPSLPLSSGKHHSASGLFKAFTDPAPDRWGRKLMRHFEQGSAKAEGRTTRTLLGSDFLAGVDDEIRMGALRFKRPGDDQFLAHTGRPVPPLLELGDLLSATDRIEKGKARKNDIQLVLAPAGSLGGARPKATIRDRNKLHIAKFPWARDEWPVIQWEAALLKLAEKAGITVPPNRMVRVGAKPVLLMERFDREAGDIRLPFISAMTALDAEDGADDRSYLEILDVIRQTGAQPRQDAGELWRRMVFNVLVSNTDDHLRNHGFLWAGQGWRLSPAYDMNPAPPHISPRIHVLALDERDHSSSIDILMSVAEHFGLTAKEAMRIAGEVATSVSTWRAAAGAQKLTPGEIAFMADAFEHDDLKAAIALGAKAPRHLTLPGAKAPTDGAPASPAKGEARKTARQPGAKKEPAKRAATKTSPVRKAAPARKR